MHHGTVSEPSKRTQKQIVAGIERRITGEAVELDVAVSHEAKRLADIVTLEQQIMIQRRVEQWDQALAPERIGINPILIGIDDRRPGTPDRHGKPSKRLRRERGSAINNQEMRT